MTPIPVALRRLFRPSALSLRARLVGGVAAIAGLAAIGAVVLFGPSPAAETPVSTAAMTVSLGAPRTVDWPEGLEASGAIAPWQEIIVGAQVAGLQLSEVRVNVGDRVRRGQILARFDGARPRAETARLSALLAQATAAAAQADADAARAAELAGSGGISDQEVLRYSTNAATARAQVAAARAQLAVQTLQLGHVDVVAPDHGVITARAATPGSMASEGQELFRMTRHGRLEWRGELTAAQLAVTRPGQSVALDLPDGASVTGRVRQIAPNLDPGSRLGLVYVDLPADSRVRAGLYAQGRILIGASPALVAPASSVVVRDGRSYVFAARTAGTETRVTARPVTVGRRHGGEVELARGAPTGGLVVDGAGFLNDGDLVRVAPSPPIAPTATSGPGAR